MRLQVHPELRVVPKYADSRIAISAVTERRRRTISFNAAAASVIVTFIGTR